MRINGKAIHFVVQITISVILITLLTIMLVLALIDEPVSSEVLATASFDSMFSEHLNESDSISGVDSASEESETDSVTDISETESEPEDPPVYIFGYTGDIRKISEESLKRLEEIILTKKKNVSIYYENLETGLTITYRADEVYTSASVIKAPFVKYVLSLNTDLEEVITTRTSVHGYKVGSKFTVRELIYYTIVYSDNKSYYELVQRFGVDGFNNMSKELGASCKITKSDNFSRMTVIDAEIFFKDIYEYALTNENGKILVDYMTACDYNKQIGKALGEKYPVAHKYGANPKSSRLAYHNSAIVYAPEPYVLCIFTDLYPQTSNASIFMDIALAIDEINSQIQ